MEWLVTKIGLQLTELLLTKLQAAAVAVYYSKIVSDAGSALDAKQIKRSTIIKSISRASTNDERRVLSIMLSELS